MFTLLEREVTSVLHVIVHDFRPAMFFSHCPYVCALTGMPAQRTSMSHDFCTAMAVPFCFTMSCLPCMIAIFFRFCGFT
jgi:hypothetical protein